MGHRKEFILCIIGVLVFTAMVQGHDPRGVPGVDYPNYFTIPETSFKCSEQKYNPGFYADLETKCQAFHFCYQDRMESFLCPTGTIFNQAVLTCDVWYKSNCSLSQMFYSVNSGPVMERAGKNLPMLLRLRNRSKSKPSIQTSTASVFDKVSSYESDKLPSETSSISKGDELKAETRDKTVGSSLKDLDNENHEIMTSDIHEDLNIKDSKETGSEQFTNEVDEEMDTNLVYDGVNDGYYKNYDQYDSEWQDTEPEIQEYNDFYASREPVSEYKADARGQFKDFMNYESFKDSHWANVKSKYSAVKKSSPTGSSHVRRQPVYTVLSDQPRTNVREITESNLGSDPSVNSELREGKEINLTSESVEAETPRPEPFPRPTAIPHHLLDISTETPMTSEEFEAAIIRELVLPGMTDVEESADSPYQQSDQSYNLRNVYSKYPEFTKRSSQTGHSRVRRKPLYVVLNDQPEIKAEEMMDASNLGSDTFNSELREGKEMNLTSESVEAETPRPEPFPRPTAIPHHLLDISTETPMTSEEFEAAIIRELVLPGMTDEEEAADSPYQQNDHGYDWINVHSNYPKFTRSSQTGHSRVRRKPAYVLHDQPEIKAEEMTDESNLGPDTFNSELREGKEMNLTSESVEAETPRPEPFPRPTAIPHHLLDISTETPMTSEEFEAAIIRELVLPGMTDEEEAADSPYAQNDEDFLQSEQTYNQLPDTERDDTIYIEDDVEPDNYATYDSQYEDVVIVPESGEEADGDTEDTFVVIPDEYDDNVVEFQMPDYPESTYRTQVLSDESPAAEYDAYNSYSSNVNYPQYYEQANYPDRAAQIYENYMPDNGRYAYESSYDLQSQPITYSSSDFDGEEAYTRAEFYPYSETRLGITEKPVALPVTEADLDNFSNDFIEVDSEQDMVQELEPGRPEDVYFVLDEQSNPGNETEIKEDEKTEFKESIREIEKVNDHSPEVKQLNSSNDESLEPSEFLDNESKRTEDFTKTSDNAWSSNSQNQHIESDNVKSDTNANPVNTFSESNLKYASQQTPSAHESLSSLNAPFSSNMGSFDFSSDSRFLNNMGYSESMDFGPYGFGPNMGQQFSMMESMQSQATSPFSQRVSPAEQPKLSPLSAIQEKMRSMKQGKFGAFKKYMSSTSN